MQLKTLFIFMILIGTVSASGRIPVMYLSEKSYIAAYCMDGIDCPKTVTNNIPPVIFLGVCVLVLIALIIVKIKNIIGHGPIHLIKR